MTVAEQQIDIENLWQRVEEQPIDAKSRRRFQQLLRACHDSLGTTDTDLLERAFQLAYWAHAGIHRADGDPFIYHPLEVAQIVATDIPFDEVTVAAALLHDVVEDNLVATVQLIEAQFGQDLALIVDGLTKIERSFDSIAVRQAENFRKLLLSMASDIRVILVKFADRLHNMRTISSLPEEKQYKIAIETRDLFAPLAHRFGLFTLKNDLEDLSLKVLDPEAFYIIKRNLRAKKRERQRYVDRFIGPIRRALEDAGLQFDIYGRPKHIYSIYRKMQQQGKTLQEIYDLFAIRVVVHTDGRQGKEDCWRAYSIITDSYQPLPERFRDFISVPKANGYKSLHTTVLGHDGKPVEVQIRTREMHEVAEMGVAAHWKYKEGDESDRMSEWDRRFAWVRELLDNPDADRATEFVQEFQHDLSGEEIYVFSPRGDLFILPHGATPVDFAFHIHTEVGLQCKGAKVNNKFVPLSHKLKSGDQVEVNTSKSKSPNAGWMQFVVTQKARSRIRHYLNNEQRTTVRAGEEIWEKKARKAQIDISDTELRRYATKLRFPNLEQMHLEIGKGLFNPDELVKLIAETEEKRAREAAGEDADLLQLQHERFLDQAQSGAPALMIDGERVTDIAITYAACCNPIPGDEVIGYLSRNGGIKIHRTTCRNVPNLLQNEDRIVPISWSRQKDMQFMAGLRVMGEDRVGIVNEITEVISKSLKTNIRSLVVDAEDGVFDGTIVLDVNDLEHLRKLMARLQNIGGIHGVYRFTENTPA